MIKDIIIDRKFRIGTFHLQKFSIMVVVKKMNVFFQQCFSTRVQIGAECTERLFTGIVKTVHPCNDNILCTKGRGFSGNCFCISFKRAKIRMKTDDIKTGFLHQSVPVIFPAFSRRLYRSFISWHRDFSV